MKLLIKYICTNQLFIVTLYILYSLLSNIKKRNVIDLTDITFNKLQQYLQTKNTIFKLNIKNNIIVMNNIKVNKYAQLFNMNIFGFNICDNLLNHLINNKYIKLHKNINTLSSNRLIICDEINHIQLLKNFTVTEPNDLYLIMKLHESQNKILKFISNILYLSNYQIILDKFSDRIFIYGEYKNGIYIIKYIYDNVTILEKYINIDWCINKTILFSMSVLINITAPHITDLIHSILI